MVNHAQSKPFAEWASRRWSRQRVECGRFSAAFRGTVPAKIRERTRARFAFDLPAFAFDFVGVTVALTGMGRVPETLFAASA